MSNSKPKFVLTEKMLVNLINSIIGEEPKRRGPPDIGLEPHERRLADIYIEGDKWFMRADELRDNIPLRQEVCGRFSRLR